MKIKNVLIIILCLSLYTSFFGSNLFAATASKAKTLTQPQKKSIKLLFPNNGEKLKMNGQYKIKWRAMGIPGNVTIFLTHNKRSLGVIARSIKASKGFYEWKVGQSLKLRIKQSHGFKITLKTSDGKVFDQSDKYFSILPASKQLTSKTIKPLSPINKPSTKPVLKQNKVQSPIKKSLIKTDKKQRKIIKLLSPNGGEKIKVGSRYQIKWSSRGIRDNVTIYLIQKNKTIATIAKNIKPATGLYNWKVNESFLKSKILKNHQYKIRIITKDRKIMDDSDKAFSIIPGKDSLPDTGKASGHSEENDQNQDSQAPPQQSPYINIIEPVKNIGWCPDKPYTIKWDSNLPVNTNVRIELVRKDQSGYFLFKNITSSTPNDGIYQFSGLSVSQIPVLSIGVSVKITTLDNAVFGVSSIVAIGKQLKLLLSTPDVWIWRHGTEYTIKWEQICDLPSPLDIELLNSSHQHILTIASNLTPLANSNTIVKIKQYKWTIPSNITPGSYYIKLSAGAVSHERPINIDVPFVVPTSPEISITSPVQGEGWCSDISHTIQWSSNLPSNTNVKIDFVQSASGGGFTVWRNITSSTQNDGAYTFTDPYPGAIAVRPKISTLDDAISSIGDAFVFGTPLTLIKPDGLYTWRKGSNYSIIWKQVCDLPDTITIDLLDSNQQHLLTLASGLSSQTKSDLLKQRAYVWTIPMNLVAGTYFIKVSSGIYSRQRSFNIGDPLN